MPHEVQAKYLQQRLSQHCPVACLHNTCWLPSHAQRMQTSTLEYRKGIMSNASLLGWGESSFNPTSCLRQRQDPAVANRDLGSPGSLQKWLLCCLRIALIDLCLFHVISKETTYLTAYWCMFINTLLFKAKNKQTKSLKLHIALIFTEQQDRKLHHYPVKSSPSPVP